MRGRIEVEGIVQGVGFRPFLHRLAEERGLSGWALNSSAGVLLEVEGPRQDVEQFADMITSQAPPLSRVLVVRLRFLPALGFHGFSIHASRVEEHALTLLCPDVATCADCLRELFDPADRRYRYPFINCTNCGPRYTIVKSLPYDRPATTMASFPLCDACRKEYEDVGDRRYHAQPIACAVCGPHLWFEDTTGQEHAGDALAEAARRLRAGETLAIKGLGGFHIACRADLDGAVLRLRRRKGRSFFKPLAIIAPSLECAQQLCEIDAESERWLNSTVSPIVLAPLKSGVLGERISRFVAPNLDRLGVMLPYTPLHHLLLAECGLPLVMTSGNLSDEPLIADNDEARQKLGPLVDGLLLHDRPIHARCDDSVLAAGQGGEPVVLRHSRGFSPYPIALPQDGPAVLALGGDIKTTFAASRGHFVFVSPHLGDAEHMATYAFFRETWEHYQALFGLKPEAIACDAHPGYHTRRWAEELARELRVPLLTAQHHHAHLVSLLVEHGLPGPLPALVADGTGYGEDGTIWGGELLYGDEHGCERLTHLRPIGLPGGDEAARQPWRIAMALIHAAEPAALGGYMATLLNGELAQRCAKLLPQRLQDDVDPSYTPPAAADVKLVAGMLRSGAGVVQSTALGRLFDGVSALLGITLRSTYEGQAPIELESVCSAQSGDFTTGWTVSRPNQASGEVIVLDWRPLVQAILSNHDNPSTWAFRLHEWVAEEYVSALLSSPHIMSSGKLLASGGCLINTVLKYLLADRCTSFGVQLVSHKNVSPGDGGLALGVLRIAQAKLSSSMPSGQTN